MPIPGISASLLSSFCVGCFGARQGIIEGSSVRRMEAYAAQLYHHLVVPRREGVGALTVHFSAMHFFTSRLQTGGAGPVRRRQQHS